MFEIGQRVVCVDVNPLDGLSDWPPRLRLVLGAVYTVSAVGRTHTAAPGLPCICIQGKSNHPYLARRFEPLPKKTTSIEVFQRMLLPTTEKV